jgi:hypothetical protein
MGVCSAKLTLSQNVYANLEVNPDSKTLLSLQLHYDSYDSVSQQKIDYLSQLSLSSDKTLHISSTQERAPTELPPLH